MSVPVVPLRLIDATVTVGADDLTLSVNQVVLQPSSEVIWESRLCSSDVPTLGRTRWVLALGFAQDVETPESLTRLLVDHAGELRSVTVAIPGRTYAVTVLLVPTSVGGVANQIPTGSVALPIIGVPVAV